MGLSPLVVSVAAAAEWPDLSVAGPTAPGDGSRDAALVVGIEDYASVDDVAGARRVAEEWYRWLAESRRVPLARLHRLTDRQAVDHKIRSELTAAASEAQAGGTLWVVFVGHGAPSRDGRDGLLIGADADRSADGIAQRSVPRSELLAMADGSAGTPVVVLDACFSGQTATGASLVPGLQPLVPTWVVASGQRATVLSATSSGEFAGPLPGAGRPAFGYLALGALRGWADADGDGSVGAAEVVEYAKGALRATVTDRTQTPTLLGPDVALAQGTERGPDLVALALSPTPAPTGGNPATPEASSAPAASVTSPTVGTLRWIPPGTFTMGSPATEVGRGDDESQHGVTLTKGFYLMEHEVTQAEWQAVMGTDPSMFKTCGPTCPVEHVSWDDATEFARRLSAQEGVTYRLPTEAEWEYAARAGTDTQYAGSSDAPTVGWVDANARQGTHPVCRLQRNAWGLCDLTGNVGEWVSDRYGDYGTAANDPTGATVGSARVVRGGGWNSRNARLARRVWLAPTTRGGDLGFRLARTAP